MIIEWDFYFGDIMEVKEGKYLIFKEVELTPPNEEGIILRIDDERIKDNYRFTGYVGGSSNTPSSTNWVTEDGTLTLKGDLDEPTMVNVRLDEIDKTDEEPKPNGMGLPFGLFGGM